MKHVMRKIAYIMVVLITLCATACGSSKEVKREIPIETFVMPSSEPMSSDSGNKAAVVSQVSTVKGLVIDKKTGEPVIGAMVVVVGHPTLGTISDIDGLFTLANLPSSATTLRISYIGMKTQEVPIHSFLTVRMEEKRGRRR